MTRLLEKAFERVRTLPEDRQDEVARLILAQADTAEAGESVNCAPRPLPVGWLRGWDVPDSFFDPLPEEILDLFEGKT